MDINKGRQAASLFQYFAQRLADKLSPKTKTYFLPLILGALLAIARRRTVTTWIRAAQISEQYRNAFYHIPNVGRKSEILFDEMIDILIEKLGPALELAQRIRFVLDDSPTKRYGPKIEGANYHHNPTPGKTNAKHCYGHSWVVAVLVVTHPLWGEISFPISAKLYLRQDDIEKLDAKYKRKFQTKTSMAVDIVKHLVPKFKAFDKKFEVIVDGGYANMTVLLPLGKMENVVTITRLRKDAVLYEIPQQPEKRGPGRPRVYGERIDVKGMVESEHGWQYVVCRQYGQLVGKWTKTFIAASKLTRGKPVKVVLVREDDKTWLPLVSTDVTLSTKEILESYGVRFGIEEVFKDLKEAWGWGKQEVRLLESNEASTTMNMLLYGMTELSTWDRSSAELVDRVASPWDDPLRRPSHADRRNFLRRELLAEEFNSVLKAEPFPLKIVELLKRLLNLAA